MAATTFGTWAGAPSSAYRGGPVDALTRLYVWSVVMEPLLLFTLFNASSTGFTGNVSKLLQFTVVTCLGLAILHRALTKGIDALRVVNLSTPLFASFRNYFLLSVLAGLIGFYSGAYDVPFEFNYSYVAFSGFSALINSPNVRPFVEYAVLLYYFFYFVVLPKYLLDSRPRVAYFLSTFKWVFILSFVLGAIDFASSLRGTSLLPRHFADEFFVPSGGRYHGFAGEPRDAFVYLFLGLAVLHLEACYRNARLSKWWVLAIVAAAVATQSTSGLVGVLIFMALYFFYTLSRITLRRLFLLPAVIAVCAFVIYVTVATSENVSRYLEAASGIWQILESGSEIPHLMAVQMVNIYPIYDLTVKFRASEFIPVLIGSGLGSASAINNFIPGLELNTVANPHSQLARVIYEGGIVGTWLFVRVFTRPVAYLTRHAPPGLRYEFMLLMLLVLGCSLGHRSSAMFIYLGIVIAALRFLDPRVKPGAAPSGRAATGRAHAPA